MTVTRSDIYSWENGRLSKLFNLIAFLITAAAYAPFVLSARYSVFHGDDFNFCLGTFAEPTKNLLRDSLVDAWNTYSTWQGTWLTNILNPLLNPLNWYSYAILRIMLMGCLLASFAFLLFLCHELCLFVGRKNREGILLAIFLLPLLSRREYTQVYLWHVGTMAYQVPMSFLSLGLALTIRGERRRSGTNALFGCLCLFLSGGGVLLIGGFGACLTLLLLLVTWLETGKVSQKFALAFLSVLTGDLLNVLAPGNYVKVPGKLPVFDAFHYSLRVVGTEFVWMLSGLILPVALLACLLIGLRSGKHLRTLSFLLAFLGLLFTPVVTAFPYLLGYSAFSPDLIADRAWFVIDVAIVFCALLGVFLLGVQFRSAIQEKQGRIIQIGVCVTASTLLLFSFPHFMNNIPVQVAENLRNGKIACYNAEWHEIYDMLSMRPGENIVIAWQPDPCVGVFQVSMGASPEHPVNFQMARYFGNSSIVDAWYAATNGVPGSAHGIE